MMGKKKVREWAMSINTCTKLHSVAVLLLKYQQDLLYGKGNSISTFDEDASRLILPVRTASYRVASAAKSSG